MIKKCEFKNLPDSFYGGTYDIFSFEVINNIPLTLYIGNEGGDMIAITGLNEMIAHRSKILPYKISVFDYPINYRNYATKQGLFKAMKQKYEARIEDLTKEHTAKLFEMFLRSITIRNTGKSALSIKHDLRFVEAYYGIKMKVLSDSDSETASVTITCDNAAINKSIAETIDKLQEINKENEA